MTLARGHRWCIHLSRLRRLAAMPGDRITYVGHATVLVELDGTRLLTDPVLRAAIGHIRRISRPPDPALTADAVLISHAHYDHLDVKSLKLLPKGPLVVAPPGIARYVRRRTRHETLDAVEGERVHVGTIDVTVTEATHDDRRMPIGQPLGAVGYIAEGRRRVYFAGDTDLFDGMSDLAGTLDVALLPVWGWGPKVGEGHMDPERAARAAALLAPRVAVPIHWGTLASPRVWWRDDPAMPAREFERLVAVHAPGVQVRILAPGDSLALPV
jgi:L-ascorbate metabolism protein UlaG (beta-lactamase superfamily)